MDVLYSIVELMRTLGLKVAPEKDRLRLIDPIKGYIGSALLSGQNIKTGQTKIDLADPDFFERLETFLNRLR